MKIDKPVNSLSIVFYSSFFLMTQITGFLLSFVICFILEDFTWEFVHMALINSFILGVSLIGSCFLTQKLMFRIKTTYVVIMTFSLILGVSIISLLIVLLLKPTLFIYYDRGAFSFLIINFLFISGLHIISSGLIIYKEIMVEKEKAIVNERFLKKQMEMRLLSSRVNPHFLFNTLNMILNLLKNPDKAEIAILNLSDLLRENLEQSNKSNISIKHEIENVRKYLEIQKLRFDNKLQYKITGNEDFLIPPLIIQPLVENSIKYNIQKVSVLTIDISIFRNTNCHTITITDSVKAVDSSMLNQGQGLTITKKRVENSNGKFLIINGGIEISFSL